MLDARFFVTAVLTQREAGGNLSEVLDNLARVMRERFKVKRQVRVISAHARITGWVLVALPPALAVAFLVVAPDTIKLLVTDPLGVQMVVGCSVPAGDGRADRPEARRHRVLRTLDHVISS